MFQAWEPRRTCRPLLQRLFSQLSQDCQAWENDRGVRDPYPRGLACRRRHPGVWAGTGLKSTLPIITLLFRLAEPGRKSPRLWGRGWERKQPHPCSLWTEDHLLHPETTCPAFYGFAALCCNIWFNSLFDSEVMEVWVRGDNVLAYDCVFIYQS